MFLNNKKNQSLMMLGLMGMMTSEEDLMFQKEQKRTFPKKVKKKIVPKGCKTYYFDRYGQYRFDQMTNIELVFSCVALNEKSAFKKYNKWIKSVVG